MSDKFTVYDVINIFRNIYIQKFPLIIRINYFQTENWLALNDNKWLNNECFMEYWFS